MNERSAGDGGARRRGSEVVREHGPAIARVCMALLGDAAAAERALERIATEAGTIELEAGRSALGRLMGIARIACANQLSKLPIRHTASFGADEPKPATTRDHAREPALARAALARLKPTEREAVVLHLVGGLDVAQVAEACGVDLDTARQRVSRGVAQLVGEEKQR